MTDEPSPAPDPTQAKTQQPLVLAVFVVFLLFVFLLGVNGLSEGFGVAGDRLLDSFFAVTENPFIALMIGILATALVQSSSVTTSMIVSLVAVPDNPLPIANAIPMVMGANIGTTVTNMIVSMAHIGRKEEFRRAFRVATCHDFFNVMAVAVLLPLELLTNYLQRTATALSSALTGIGGMDYDSPIKGLLKAALDPIKDLIGLTTASQQLAGIVLICLSGAMIFTALMLLVRTLRSALRTRVEMVVTRAFGRGAVIAMLIGLIVTAMVQSSSITTSLLVPLAGAGLITLEQAFPITIGANIGTTVTALLAALAATGQNAAAGITIALVHLLFNLSGTLLIYPVERIREIPLAAARWLADTAAESRRWAILWVLFFFYGIPAVFAVINNVLK
ncbi:MAG: Na/Pi symporter [Gemmatimonadota bacterium]|nr:MAG: Na/Pi symporter [Gemmatimonadota bacterium]